MLFIVMGVSGCGKSTVGKMLAERLSLPFFDADDFHSKENIERMSKGIALNDNDREPWLQLLAKLMESNEDQGLVLACSALKEKYRGLLTSGIKKEISWIFLEGSREILLERLQGRIAHFMKPLLLESQLETLEIPDYAHSISIELNPEEIVNEIIKKFKV